jgi:poly(3-hydroxybutyrate) depolymerase
LLTAFADWQRAGLRPWLALARNAYASLPGASPLAALADLALLNLATGEARAQGLATATVARHAGRALESELLLDHPFATVRALRAAGARPPRRILLAAPYSGYAATVLSSLIGGLADDAEVMVTDWRDARLVPLAAGRFDLEHQIALLADLMRRPGPALHVVALSQATVPALLAAGALAADDPMAAPATLALLGGPIDPRRNPTAANGLFLALPPEAVAATWFRRVDARHPGAGRAVLPSLHHLLLFALAHPEPYFQAQYGAFLELAGATRSGWLAGLADLHALIDVPAELVLQVLRHVFHAPAASNRGLRLAGRELHAATLTRTALLTVEAASDALVGPGQTHAAHDLTPALTPVQRGRLTLPGAAHHDLFTGPLMARRIAPALKAFMAAGER